MKEIVILSGKGGTGKTSIAAAFVWLGGHRVVAADCDVDAADLHLLLAPDFDHPHDFWSGEKAFIHQEDCNLCGHCYEICRFKAIYKDQQAYTVNPQNCEGCGYCARACPVHAITNEPVKVGSWYISKIKTGSTMVHARLGIGADNSGKLVARVRSEASNIAREQKKDHIIIDGAPGIGCPVISSLSGTDFAVLVTEPTISGLHDLKRIYQLVKMFHIKAGCIINKADLNQQVTKEIMEFLRHENIIHLASLPYDETFTEAITSGKTLPEYSHQDLVDTLADTWNTITHV